MLRILAAVALCLSTWVVDVFHMATLPRDQTLGSQAIDQNSLSKSFFQSRKETEINQLAVYGDPYTRGVAESRLTKNLLPPAEKILFEEFNYFFTNPLLRWGFIVTAMRWFAGVDRYLPTDLLRVNAGIASSAPTAFDYYLDTPSRQIAYHGIHEVGQFFVDVERDDFGCTLFAAKTASEGWILGRNFDFELQRFFDEEKIMKWNFPDRGYAYLNVIWVGMYGAVTGVNEKGVYISINAAGSTDFRRYGTPSSMVVTEALLNAATAAEAVDQIARSTIFVTDIFVVADRDHVFRLEKSPRRYQVTEIKSDAVVTNHLVGRPWIDDSINSFRRRELTSSYRLQRGEQLMASITTEDRTDARLMEHKILGFLRDRNDLDGSPLHLGNRRAIDAMIASHSVIYNGADARLFVSAGPALVGKYVGFDLAASFALKKPVRLPEGSDLPPDSTVTPEQFYRLKNALSKITLADRMIRGKRCDLARTQLDEVSELYSEHTNYYLAEGLFADRCLHNSHLARRQWAKALSLQPAYAKQRKFLEERVL